MKKWGMLAGTAALLVIVGCQGTTVEGTGGKKLTLTKPGDHSVKQDDATPIKIAITREKFNDPVTVVFENLPSGVEVQEKDLKIPADTNSATFNLHAKAGAGLVDNHEVRVTVQGPEKMKATESFKLSVKAKS